MYPRLQLLKRLLSDDGVVFVSIDDDEVHTLRIILDEIFGRSNRLATFTWRTDGNFDNQAKIKVCHEYVLTYAKKPDLFPHPPVVDPSVPQESKLFRPIIRNTIVKNGHKNPVDTVVLPVGFPADFERGTIAAREDLWPKFSNDIRIKDGKIVDAVEVRSGWSSKKILDSFISSGFQGVKDTKGQETVFVITQTGAIETIKKREKPSHVISTLSGFGSVQSMSAELLQSGIKFPYPKPVDLLSYLISLIDDRDFIVLDSFAGSGTTAHAVQNLNKSDAGNRKFILIEMMDYAESITAERVRQFIDSLSMVTAMG
jgi:hypothetical protein